MQNDVKFYPSRTPVLQECKSTYNNMAGFVGSFKSIYFGELHIYGINILAYSFIINQLTSLLSVRDYHTK